MKENLYFAIPDGLPSAKANIFTDDTRAGYRCKGNLSKAGG